MPHYTPLAGVDPRIKETWRSLDNPRVFVVVSVWGTREHWEGWLKDEFRQKVDETIKPMLRKPSTIKVFEEVATLPPPEEGQLRGARRSRRGTPGLPQ